MKKRKGVVNCLVSANYVREIVKWKSWRQANSRSTIVSWCWKNKKKRKVNEKRYVGGRERRRKGVGGGGGGSERRERDRVRERGRVRRGE